MIAILALSALLIVTTLLAGGVADYLIGKALTEDLKKESERALSIFSAAAVEPVISEDIAVLLSIVDQLAEKESGIHSIKILNERQEVLLDWRIAALGSDDLVAFHQDITYYNEPFGSITIFWDSHDLNARIDAYVSTVQAILAAILICFSLVVINYVYFSTIRPIRTISDTLFDINNGEHKQKLSLKSSREFSLLSSSVNELADLHQEITMQASKLRQKNSELEKMHKELAENQTQLLHSEKLSSIGQLAAGVAHEINTPTQFIGDNTRFLQGSFEDLIGLIQTYQLLGNAVNEGSVTPGLAEKARTLGEKIDIEYLVEEIPIAINQSLEGVGLVTEIVRSMKEFSHPGSKEKAAIDINKAIETTATVSRNEWKYDAEMETEFDLSLPPVPCLPSELNQVILNIIVNAAHAIKAAKSNGSTQQGIITISTRKDDDCVEIRIRDTGMGIPEEIRNRIFDPFFTTKEVGKGTGQGLAIAHSVIADKHGGTLRVESEVGKGSTFIIRLPLDQAVDDMDAHPDSETNQEALHSACG